jgi:hypothetical protein
VRSSSRTTAKVFGHDGALQENRRIGAWNPKLGRMCFLQDVGDKCRQGYLPCLQDIDFIDEKLKKFFKGCEAEESVVWWRPADVVNLNHSKFDHEIDTKMENKLDIRDL